MPNHYCTLENLGDISLFYYNVKPFVRQTSRTKNLFKVLTCFGCENKTGVEVARILIIFFKLSLCSATLMDSSRRDLLNHVAEHVRRS